MARKDWKRSKFHGTTNTKIAWETKKQPGKTLSIIKDKSSNIPYKIILNNQEVDSTGTFVKAKKIAQLQMGKN